MAENDYKLETLTIKELFDVGLAYNKPVIISNAYFLSVVPGTHLELSSMCKDSSSFDSLYIYTLAKPHNEKSALKIHTLLSSLVNMSSFTQPTFTVGSSVKTLNYGIRPLLTVTPDRDGYVKIQIDHGFKYVKLDDIITQNRFINVFTASIKGLYTRQKGEGTGTLNLQEITVGNVTTYIHPEK